MDDSGHIMATMGKLNALVPAVGPALLWYLRQLSFLPPLVKSANAQGARLQHLHVGTEAQNPRYEFRRPADGHGEPRRAWRRPVVIPGLGQSDAAGVTTRILPSNESVK
jgi:hypothetical protein